DGRPVFALNLGWGNPWSGWTILPRSNFGGYRSYANRFAVEPRRVPARTAFVARTAPPALPARFGRTHPNGDRTTVGVAVPREAPAGNRAAPVVIRPSQQPPMQPAVASPAAAPAAEGRRIAPAPGTQVPTHYG